jgi:hypothetical protein
MTFRPYDVLILQAAEAASARSTAIVYPLTNGSGAPVDALIPVTLNDDGNFKILDVSVESDALNAIGITAESILNNTEGPVVGFGRMVDITTPFAFKDVIYVSKSGNLTNVQPDIDVGGFVSGDFVIKIGKIAKNQTNPSNKDLIVQVELIGQL